MGDNEIIKALGDCLHRGCNVCIRRPEEYGATERQCSRGLMECALSLIQRQKAEIERLKANNAYLMLPQYARKTVVETAKADVIKEFAERLEPRLANNTDISAVGYQSIVAEISNLVKEMVGDNNV